jgi:hypothetical protein
MRRILPSLVIALAAFPVLALAETLEIRVRLGLEPERIVAFPVVPGARYRVDSVDCGQTPQPGICVGRKVRSESHLVVTVSERKRDENVPGGAIVGSTTPGDSSYVPEPQPLSAEILPALLAISTSETGDVRWNSQSTPISVPSDGNWHRRTIPMSGGFDWSIQARIGRP